MKWKNFPRYWPFVRGIHRSPVNSPHKGQWRGAFMFLSHVFTLCVCVCVSVCLSMFVTSRCLSGRCNYEGLVPHKQYFAGTLLGIFSCASYVLRIHDVIDGVTRSQSGSNFEIDTSPSIFELEHRSKAQNVGNANGYRFGILNFRYNFR